MAEPKIIFNSSLPRAGSTLLQNILAQNPRFYCSPTSGLFNLLLAARDVATNSPAFKAQDPALMRAAFLGFCRQGLTGYYAAITDKPVCCDKSRGWYHAYEWLHAFQPNPKLLVCVRDLRAILSSYEKLFRKNKHLQDSAEDEKTMNMITVRNRVIHWMNSNPIGLGVTKLADTIETGNVRHFHIIRFEDLTTNPKTVMQRVYDYLEEPAFDHDFDHVAQVTHEDDSYHGVYGDHTIRAKVAPVPPDYFEVLGKDLARLVRDDNELFYSTFYPDKR